MKSGPLFSISASHDLGSFICYRTLARVRGNERLVKPQSGLKSIKVRYGGTKEKYVSLRIYSLCKKFPALALVSDL